MKSEYQHIRSKKRLIIYLLKISARGEIVKTNLAKLIQDIYLLPNSSHFIHIVRADFMSN